MSDTEKNIQPHADTPGNEATAQAKLTGRRRFIRLGATSTAAVTATLVSRPVMAWNCHSTSAWGSAQLANQVGSAKTRLDRNQVNSAECWYIEDWKSTSSSSTCWKTVGQRRFSNSTAAAGMGCTVAQILPNGISGCTTNSSTTAISVINGPDAFASAIVVARLNSLYGAGAANIQACIISGQVDQVLEMARLGANYSPPNTGVKWSKAQIQGYLSGNWLARSKLT